MSSEQPESDQLALLLRVNAVLSSTLTLDEALHGLIVGVIESLGAERGFVVLRKAGEWQSAAAHYVDPQKRAEALSFSRSVVEKVAATGEAMLAVDAAEMDTPPPPSVTLQGIRSILCAPLRWLGEVRGLVYLDHTIRQGVFKESQRALLGAICNQAARTLENAALHDELQRAHQRGLLQAGESSSATVRESPHAEGLSQVERTAGRSALDFLLGSLGDPLAAGRWENAEKVVAANPLGDLTLETEMVCIHLFGALKVEVGDRAVEDWASRKDLLLFSYLATHRDQVIHEEKLMDVFWPGGGKNAKHSLHNSVTQIRKRLGSKDLGREVLRRKFEGYTLGTKCWTDLAEFRQAFQDGKQAAREGRPTEASVHLQKAEALAHKEFLEGFMEEWVVDQRSQIELLVSECRTLLADDFQARGKHLMALELWRRVLDQDNCSEAAYRGTLEALRALKRRTEAVRVYQTCVATFREELDLEAPQGLAELVDF